MQASNLVRLVPLADIAVGNPWREEDRECASLKKSPRHRIIELKPYISTSGLRTSGSLLSVSQWMKCRLRAIQDSWFPEDPRLSLA